MIFKHLRISILFYLNLKSLYFDLFFNFSIDVSTNQNHKASINNFWTMALGNFDKRVIEEVNQTMKGQLVNIETEKDLIERYIQIAEIL